MAKITVTVTLETDYPLHLAKNAVLDALYEARYARGGDYLYKHPIHAKLTPEKFDAKIDANHQKREFYQDVHSALCAVDFEVVDEPESKVDPDDS